MIFGNFWLLLVTDSDRIIALKKRYIPLYIEAVNSSEEKRWE
jgi:hypothetical protein